MKKRLPVQQKAQMMANLKRNWYFPISAMAYFCLNVDNTVGYCVGLPIVFMIMIVAASQIPSAWSLIKERSVAEKILCLSSAAGICLGGQANFYKKTLRLALKSGLPETMDKLLLLVSCIGAACALFFVFFCLLVFWKEMKRVTSGLGLTDNVNRKEWTIYALLLVMSLGFMAVSFTRSQAFYGTEFSYNIIYTSDSTSLVKENAYLVLTQSQNDLRQPLFSVFAAPFVGLPYLAARLIGASASVWAILVNSVQIFMLYAANFMLAKMMKLDRVKRICFMVLTACTYTQLLFTLMMEQYIIAYFWLIFCMYLIVERQRPNRIAIWGAGGTLLTSMILLPFMSTRSPVKEFKAWFLDMVKYGLEFAALLMCFCRFDVIFGFVSQMIQLSVFTGKSVTFTDKIYQYTSFVNSCFAAPSAGINTTAEEYITWQLNGAAGINFVGVLILALVVFSAIWNRDKMSSRLAAVWVGFSVVILLGIGWGTKENGLILYALYFAWAFLVLLFQLVEKIQSRLNVEFILPAVTVLAAAGMLMVNVPAMMELLHFAITCYPA